MNIFFISDNNAFEALVASVKMIVRNNKQVCFYILHNGIEEQKLAVLSQLCSKNKVQIKIILMDEGMFNSPIPGGSPHKTKVARFKFLIGNFEVDRALYLDTDLYFKGSLHDLYHTNLEHHIIAAIPDVNHHTFNKNLGILKNYNYFNSGVLLIDCKKWKLHHLSDKLIQINEEKKDVIKYVDQDSFNILFAELGYKQLSIKWNLPSANQYFKFGLKNFLSLYKLVEPRWSIIKAFLFPSIIHFIGVPKPQDGNNTPYAKQYLKYYN